MSHLSFLINLFYSKILFKNSTYNTSPDEIEHVLRNKSKSKKQNKNNCGILDFLNLEIINYIKFTNINHNHIPNFNKIGVG